LIREVVIVNLICGQQMYTIEFSFNLPDLQEDTLWFPQHLAPRRV
jgi:hypothetical protein